MEPEHSFSYKKKKTAYVPNEDSAHPAHLHAHYENTPIQIYRKFHQKLKKNQIKISNIFPISAQNIDCGYSLEPPRRKKIKIREIMYTPVNPIFTR